MRKKKYFNLIVSLIIILGIPALFVLNYIAYVNFSYATSDKSGTAVETKYHMDEKSNFVSNIPYEEYLDYQESPLSGIVINVKDFSASPLNTPEQNQISIQNAIDEASRKCGTVLISDGTYISNPLTLKSNVTLKIASNAILQSVGYDQYMEYRKKSNLENVLKLAFINSSNTENVTIMGPGRIAGNGATYCLPAKNDSAFLPLNVFNLKTYILEHRSRIMMGKKNEYIRPFILGINNCKNFKVTNIEIYESASWTCRMQDCTDLAFKDVIINNNVHVANSDGIDICGGKNITIDHCFIATGDDGICAKTEKQSGEISGLFVNNCEIMSLANCFKIGTDTHKNINNIIVENCFFFMAGIAGGYAGIAIESTDGALVSNININNINMQSVCSPLLIWLGRRNGVSQLQNICVKNIIASDCDIASAIVGYDNHGIKQQIKNIVLENFNIQYRNVQEKLNVYRKDILSNKNNMQGYPEITRVSHNYLINHKLSLYYDIPVYGLYVKHAQDISIKNFKVVPRDCNTRQISNIQINQ